MGKVKTSKQLERHLKGVANHRRIDILFLIKDASGLTLDEIAGRMRCNFKTVAGHTRRLVEAGLLNKRYRGREVMHSLSPYGVTFIQFIHSFSHSREYKNE